MKQVPVTSSKKAEKKRGSKQIVEMLIGNMDGQLTDVKPSVADFLRLLQYQKEIEEEEPREVTVQWVETPEKK